MSLLDWILLASLLSLVFLISFKGLGCSKNSEKEPDIKKKEKSIEKILENRFNMVEQHINDNFEYLKNEKIKVDKELSEVKKTLEEKREENSSFKSDKKQFESKLENLQSDKVLVDKNLSETKESLKSKEEENNTLTEENKELKSSLNEKENELKETTKEIKKLEQFESSIKSPKLMTLLNTLLVNPALGKHREKSAIVDDSAQSILNLLLKLSTGQIFVKSYYETLVEYKKENQKVMSSEEVAFYEAINDFFGEEIIKNPNITKVEGKFDKSKHRGINNEKEGTIDSGIVLIPSDTTNNDKIKVKLT
jgi:septal ring factor EnvC (AmiA/AmiB activator)